MTPAPPHPDQLRASARAARRALVGPDREWAQAAVCDHVVALLSAHRPGTVAWYLATDGEVDLSGALDRTRGAGWRPHLPVVGPARSMAFAPWDDGAELVPNRYGVPEPGVPPAAHVAAIALDVVLLPCVAVDRRGHRLGFGAGYYDRALAGSHPGRPLLAGVAFDVQVVEEVPARPWDVPLQALVTEAGVLVTDGDVPRP